MATSGPKTNEVVDPKLQALAHPLTDDEDEEEEILSTVLASTIKEDPVRADLHKVNSLGFDDDTDAKDVFINVEDPQKHVTKMETYVTYKVATKTTRGDFDHPEYGVRRRYQDFLWLRQKLEETQPTHLVPPLPEKHSMKLDRFSPEFIKTRQYALNKFLGRIAEHPTLSYNEYFKIFLTAKELSAHKKQASGIVSRFGSSLKAVTSAYMLKNRAPEFTMMGEYIQTFSEKMGSIDRISQRILKEQIAYQEAMVAYGPAFRLWSGWEVDSADIMTSIAACVETCAQSQKELIESQELEFTPPMKEYILYSESIKNVLKKRDHFQMDFELTQDELTRKKNDREQVKISDQNYSLGAIMGKDPQDVKEQKSYKLDSQIEKLQKQVEFMNDKTECANADLKADMDRWHRNKRKDMKESLIGMAQRHSKYYEQMLAAWEDVIKVLRDQDLELPEPPHLRYTTSSQDSQTSSSETREDSWVKLDADSSPDSGLS